MSTDSPTDTAGPSSSGASSSGAGASGAGDPELQAAGDEAARRYAELTEILEAIRPAVQADGGDLALVDVDLVAGEVEVQLQGACSSCAVSSMTLQAGIERILRDRLDWVTEVRGGVDETVDAAESAAMGRGGYVPRSDAGV